MLFSRKQPTAPSFEDRLATLPQGGFDVARQADGRIVVRKQGCAAVISAGSPPRVERAGWEVGGRIARLVDGGYQKFWDSGERQVPALASQLRALHAFEEDLLEALGLESLYNTSLGTVNDVHNYDRVDGR
jgi:hypothetical protein